MTNNIKKSRMVMYIEFHKSQNPDEIEEKIRNLVKSRKLPSIRNLMIGIDYKNMRTIIPQTVYIQNEKNRTR